MMDNNIVKYICGSIIGLLVGIESILVPVLLLISIDFVLGIITDIKACLIRNDKFGVRSDKLWKTILKLSCTMAAVLVSQIFTNSYMDWIGINVGKMIAGIIAVTELYSILGHLVYISEWKVLNHVRIIFKKEIESKVGHNINIEE